MKPHTSTSGTYYIPQKGKHVNAKAAVSFRVCGSSDSNPFPVEITFDLTDGVGIEKHKEHDYLAVRFMPSVFSMSDFANALVYIAGKIREAITTEEKHMNK